MKTESLRNIGPQSAEWLARIGMHDAEAVRAADAFELYRQLLSVMPSANINMLYALLGAQQDRDWREVAREQRTEILLRLDEMGLAPR